MNYFHIRILSPRLFMMYVSVAPFFVYAWWVAVYKLLLILKKTVDFLETLQLFAVCKIQTIKMWASTQKTCLFIFILGRKRDSGNQFSCHTSQTHGFICLLCCWTVHTLLPSLLKVRMSITLSSSGKLLWWTVLQI